MEIKNGNKTEEMHQLLRSRSKLNFELEFLREKSLMHSEHPASA
jgi:hypothetical protein